VCIYEEIDLNMYLTLYVFSYSSLLFLDDLIFSSKCMYVVLLMIRIACNCNDNAMMKMFMMFMMLMMVMMFNQVRRYIFRLFN
jgi:hypothetical protein